MSLDFYLFIEINKKKNVYNIIKNRTHITQATKIFPKIKTHVEQSLCLFEDMRVSQPKTLLLFMLNKNEMR